MTQKDKEFLKELYEVNNNNNSQVNVTMKQVVTWVIAILVLITSAILIPMAFSKGRVIDDTAKLATSNQNSVDKIVLTLTTLTNKVDASNKTIDQVNEKVNNLKTNSYSFNDHNRNMVPYDMRITSVEKRQEVIEERQRKILEEINEIWTKIAENKREVDNLKTK